MRAMLRYLVVAACWGGGRATPGTHLEDQPGSGINTDAIRLVDGEEWVATDKWEYARREEAQGQVTTLAGHSSEEGYADGCGANATVSYTHLTLPTKA